MIRTPAATFRAGARSSSICRRSVLSALRELAGFPHTCVTKALGASGVVDTPVSTRECEVPALVARVYHHDPRVLLAQPHRRPSGAAGAGRLLRREHDVAAVRRHRVTAADPSPALVP